MDVETRPLTMNFQGSAVDLPATFTKRFPPRQRSVPFNVSKMDRSYNVEYLDLHGSHYGTCVDSGHITDVTLEMSPLALVSLANAPHRLKVIPKIEEHIVAGGLVGDNQTSDLALVSSHAHPKWSSFQQGDTVAHVERCIPSMIQHLEEKPRFGKMSTEEAILATCKSYFEDNTKSIEKSNVFKSGSPKSTSVIVKQSPPKKSESSNKRKDLSTLQSETSLRQVSSETSTKRCSVKSPPKQTKAVKDQDVQTVAHPVGTHDMVMSENDNTTTMDNSSVTENLTDKDDEGEQFIPTKLPSDGYLDSPVDVRAMDQVQDYENMSASEIYSIDETTKSDMTCPINAHPDTQVHSVMQQGRQNERSVHPPTGAFDTSVDQPVTVASIFSTHNDPFHELDPDIAERTAISNPFFAFRENTFLVCSSPRKMQSIVEVSDEEDDGDKGGDCGTAEVANKVEKFTSKGNGDSSLTHCNAVRNTGEIKTLDKDNKENLHLDLHSAQEIHVSQSQDMSSSQESTLGDTQSNIESDSSSTDSVKTDGGIDPVPSPTCPVCLDAAIKNQIDPSLSAGKKYAETKLVKESSVDGRFCYEHMGAAEKINNVCLGFPKDNNEETKKPPIVGGVYGWDRGALLGSGSSTHMKVKSKTSSKSIKSRKIIIAKRKTRRLKKRALMPGENLKGSPIDLKRSRVEFVRTLLSEGVQKIIPKSIPLKSLGGEESGDNNIIADGLIVDVNLEEQQSPSEKSYRKDANEEELTMKGVGVSPDKPTFYQKQRSKIVKRDPVDAVWLKNFTESVRRMSSFMLPEHPGTDHAKRIRSLNRKTRMCFVISPDMPITASHLWFDDDTMSPIQNYLNLETSNALQHRCHYTNDSSPPLSRGEQAAARVFPSEGSLNCETRIQGSISTTVAGGDIITTQKKRKISDVIPVRNKTSVSKTTTPIKGIGKYPIKNKKVRVIGRSQVVSRRHRKRELLKASSAPQALKLQYTFQDHLNKVSTIAVVDHRDNDLNIGDNPFIMLKERQSQPVKGDACLSQITPTSIYNQHNEISKRIESELETPKDLIVLDNSCSNLAQSNNHLEFNSYEFFKSGMNNSPNINLNKNVQRIRRKNISQKPNSHKPKRKGFVSRKSHEAHIIRLKELQEQQREYVSNELQSQCNQDIATIDNLWEGIALDPGHGLWNQIEMMEEDKTKSDELKQLQLQQQLQQQQLSVLTKPIIGKIATVEVVENAPSVKPTAARISSECGGDVDGDVSSDTDAEEKYEAQPEECLQSEDAILHDEATVISENRTGIQSTKEISKAPTECNYTDDGKKYPPDQNSVIQPQDVYDNKTPDHVGHGSVSRSSKDERNRHTMCESCKMRVSLKEGCVCCLCGGVRTKLVAKGNRCYLDKYYPNPYSYKLADMVSETRRSLVCPCNQKSAGGEPTHKGKSHTYRDCMCRVPNNLLPGDLAQQQTETVKREKDHNAKQSTETNKEVESKRFGDEVTNSSLCDLKKCPNEKNDPVAKTNAENFPNYRVEQICGEHIGQQKYVKNITETSQVTAESVQNTTLTNKPNAFTPKGKTPNRSKCQDPHRDKIVNVCKKSQHSKCHGDNQYVEPIRSNEKRRGNENTKFVPKLTPKDHAASPHVVGLGVAGKTRKANEENNESLFRTYDGHPCTTLGAFRSMPCTFEKSSYGRQPVQNERRSASSASSPPRYNCMPSHLRYSSPCQPSPVKTTERKSEPDCPCPSENYLYIPDWSTRGIVKTSVPYQWKSNFMATHPWRGTGVYSKYITASKTQKRVSFQSPLPSFCFTYEAPRDNPLAQCASPKQGNTQCREKRIKQLQIRQTATTKKTEERIGEIEDTSKQNPSSCRTCPFWKKGQKCHCNIKTKTPPSKNKQKIKVKLCCCCTSKPCKCSTQAQSCLCETNGEVSSCTTGKSCICVCVGKSCACKSIICSSPCKSNIFDQFVTNQCQLSPKSSLLRCSKLLSMMKEENPKTDCATKDVGVGIERSSSRIEDKVTYQSPIAEKFDTPQDFTRTYQDQTQDIHQEPILSNDVFVPREPPEEPSTPKNDSVSIKKTISGEQVAKSSITSIQHENKLSAARSKEDWMDKIFNKYGINDLNSGVHRPQSKDLSLRSSQMISEGWLTEKSHQSESNAMNSEQHDNSSESNAGHIKSFNLADNTVFGYQCGGVPALPVDSPSKRLSYYPYNILSQRRTTHAKPIGTLSRVGYRSTFSSSPMKHFRNRLAATGTYNSLLSSRIPSKSFHISPYS